MPLKSTRPLTRLPLQEQNGTIRLIHSLSANIEGRSVPKHQKDTPLMVKCPNCKQTREPDYNETTRRYVCSLCAGPVDAQVLIEKKKRGLR